MNNRDQISEGGSAEDNNAQWLLYNLLSLGLHPVFL